MKPIISTYINNTEQIELAISAGANHLIIDHPEISSSPFCANSTENLDTLQNLIKKAKSLNPQINISLNNSLIKIPNTKILSLAKIIRIQDLGLIHYLKENHSKLKIHYSPATGNLNTKSIKELSKCCESQTLSNELTYSEISEITNSVPNNKFELQVHGPILIQQSYRRFLTGYENPNANFDEAASITRKIEDQDHPEKNLTLTDNKNGSFCFWHEHKCLALHPTELLNLKLHSWLIDARGESLDYLKYSIKLYKYLAKNKKISKQLLSKLKTASKHKFTPGFFIENNTDKSRSQSNNEDTNQVGTIVDVVRERYVTIEIQKNISLNQNILCINPEKKEVNIIINTLLDIDDNPILSSKNQQFAKIKWQKGIQPKSKLFTA
jgi:collagenase-like PrtC family protease